MGAFVDGSKGSKSVQKHNHWTTIKALYNKTITIYLTVHFKRKVDSRNAMFIIFGKTNKDVLNIKMCRMLYRT